MILRSTLHYVLHDHTMFLWHCRMCRIHIDIWLDLCLLDGALYRILVGLFVYYLFIFRISDIGSENFRKSLGSARFFLFGFVKTASEWKLEKTHKNIQIHRFEEIPRPSLVSPGSQSQYVI
jgi:hypothetical protein